MSNDKPPPGNGAANSSGNWLQKFKKLLPGAPKDRQTLIEILRHSEQHKLLDPDALIWIEGALHVADMQVRNIMIPKVQMISIKNEAGLSDIIKTVVDSGHSRFPVIGADSDEVLGILLAKDLLAIIDQQHFALQDIMRPAVFVPESKRLNVLLREFRADRQHMAIVVDEYGVAGLVTIEDVIEEIVGEIEDEYDLAEAAVQQHSRQRYTVKATQPIAEFNKYFQTDLSDNDYDTVGGLVINAFGHLPKRGESIDFAGYNVKVLRADKRRIHVLRLEKLAEQVEEG